MVSQILIYGYGLVCLSMLVYNLVYSLYLRADTLRLERRVRNIDRRVAVQLDALRAGREVSRRHLDAMARRLRRVRNLLAFDRYLDTQIAREPAFQAYLRRLQPVLLYLATVYRRREVTRSAYFCHFLARHQLQRHMQMDQIQQVLLTYLDRDNLYCRVNALKALCAFGSADTVVQALERLEKGGAQLHEKVVTETLLSYTGDRTALMDRVWKRLERFSAAMQRALLDYIRFCSGAYQREMLDILRDEGRDKELRLTAIRYVGRYPYGPAREPLLGLVEDGNPLRWEFAAIAASALAGYGGEAVTAALAEAMHSPNWYVRYNAAASLEARGLAYEDLLAIAGGDRYAQEMLTYRLESRRLTAEREAVAV